MSSIAKRASLLFSGSAAAKDAASTSGGETVATDIDGFYQRRLLEATRTGFADNLSEQQRKALEELRMKLYDPSFAFSTEAKREPDGDRFFLRFLRATMSDKKGARIFNVEDAFARLERMYKWRKEYDIDELQKHVDNGTHPEGFEKFREVSPALNLVNPETGELMRIGLFGRFLSYVDTNVFTEREWIRWFAYDFLLVLQILRQESKKHGREISAHHSVPDVSGLSLIGVMQRIKFIQMMSNVAADFFPEVIEANYFVRSPWIFTKCFAAVKPFLDKDTVSKFVMTTDVPLELFERIIPKKLIPKEYGGESDAVLVEPLHSRSKPDLPEDQ